MLPFAFRAFVALALATASLGAQSPLADGRSAMLRHDLTGARAQLERALRTAPGDYEANWRLAIVLQDLGKRTPDTVRSAARDSLYALAESYARRAVTAKADGAEGHFALAAAIGRVSLTLGTRARIARAAEIRDEALRAVALDSTHSGAWHILGRWHAEIRRLSGVQRFVARNFLGGAVFDAASWDDAERSLARAVALDPARITHRLELARVLVDRKRWPAAMAQLDTLATLAPDDPMDPDLQRQGAALAQTVQRKPPR